MKKVLLYTSALGLSIMLSTSINAQDTEGKADKPATGTEAVVPAKISIEPAKDAVKAEPVKKPVKKAAKAELKHVGNLLDTVIPHLVNKRGEKIDYKELKEKEFVVFYWSALWCGPCRKFSPQLIDFYNKFGGGKRFEVVFVSLDKSEAKMKHYMKKMPWVAIGWGQKPNTRIKEFAGGGIPHLMLIDKDGNILGRGKRKAYVVFQKLIDVLAEGKKPVEKTEAKPEPSQDPKAEE